MWGAGLLALFVSDMEMLLLTMMMVWFLQVGCWPHGAEFPAALLGGAHLWSPHQRNRPREHAALQQHLLAAYNSCAYAQQLHCTMRCCCCCCLLGQPLGSLQEHLLDLACAQLAWLGNLLQQQLAVCAIVIANELQSLQQKLSSASYCCSCYHSAAQLLSCNPWRSAACDTDATDDIDGPCGPSHVA